MKWMIKYNTLKNEYEAFIKQTKDNLFTKTIELKILKDRNRDLEKTNKELRKKIKELKNKER